MVESGCGISLLCESPDVWWFVLCFTVSEVPNGGSDVSGQPRRQQSAVRHPRYPYADWSGHTGFRLVTDILTKWYHWWDLIYFISQFLMGLSFQTKHLDSDFLKGQELTLIPVYLIAEFDHYQQQLTCHRTVAPKMGSGDAQGPNDVIPRDPQHYFTIIQSTGNTVAIFTTSLVMCFIHFLK